jgi:hypothetical protein
MKWIIVTADGIGGDYRGHRTAAGVVPRFETDRGTSIQRTTPASWRRSARDQVAIDLTDRLAVRVPKPELDVLEAPAIDLDNPIHDRVPKGIGGNVARLASATVR